MVPHRNRRHAGNLPRQPLNVLRPINTAGASTHAFNINSLAAFSSAISFFAVALAPPVRDNRFRRQFPAAHRYFKILIGEVCPA